MCLCRKGVWQLPSLEATERLCDTTVTNFFWWKCHLSTWPPKRTTDKLLLKILVWFFFPIADKRFNFPSLSERIVSKLYFFHLVNNKSENFSYLYASSCKQTFFALLNCFFFFSDLSQVFIAWNAIQHSFREESINDIS